MPLVDTERLDDVLVLRLNRPPVNAITLELCQAAEETVNTARADDAVRAIVLTGAGDTFSAGLDLKAVPTYTREQQAAMIRAVNRTVNSLYGFDRPVVSAVNGHAVAGGLCLALCGDYRIGPDSPDVKIGLTEARAGIPFPAGPLAVLKAELDSCAVRVLTLQARNITPKRAQSMGIFDELVAPDQVLERALDVARDLAGVDAHGYSGVKRQVRAETLARLKDIVQHDNDPLLETWLADSTTSAAAQTLRDAPS